MKTTLSKQYESRRPLAVLPLSNFGGLAILDILAFTKQWDNIRGVNFTDNVSIVLSAWPGTTIPEDLRELYSVAWLNDGSEPMPADAIECPGNCSTCGVCWSLSKRHIDVFFNKH